MTDHELHRGGQDGTDDSSPTRSSVSTLSRADTSWTGLPLSCFREEGGIHAAVEAGRDRCARDAPVDQLGGLGVVPALLLAYGGSDVFGCSVRRATFGRVEPICRFILENVALLAYADPRLEVRDLEMIVALFDHFPERHVRRVAVPGDVERGQAERIGLQLE